MSERATYVLDASFAVRPTFAAFWDDFLSRPGRGTVVVPRAVADLVAQWAESHPVAAVRALAQAAAGSLARPHPSVRPSAEPAGAEAPSPGAARRAVLAAAFPPNRPRTPTVILTHHGNTVLAAELLQRDTPAPERGRLEFGLLPASAGRLVLRASWYTRAPRRSVLGRLLWWRGPPPDPAPPFAPATVKRVVGDREPSPTAAKVAAAEGVRLVRGRGGPVVLGPVLRDANSKARQGGEGQLFAVEGADDLVCKVFLPEHRTPTRAAKLRRMARPGWGDPDVCWPLDVVGADRRNPLGFLMRRARNALPLGESLFLDPAKFQGRHGRWDRRHSVALALRVAETVARLHALGVVLGDLGGDNILLDPESFLARWDRGVYFVDCDSFQVEDFPCPVGRPEYTPRDRQGQDFREVLRSQKDDLFALAVLLFQIFVPGRHPYQCRGAEGGPDDWVRRGVFPYAEMKDGPAAGGPIPTANDRFAWSHLSPALRQLFGRAFGQGEPVRSAAWVDALYDYGLLLSDPQRVFRSPIRGRIDLNILPHYRYAE
jgi:hypothetical protein